MQKTWAPPPEPPKSAPPVQPQKNVEVQLPIDATFLPPPPIVPPGQGEVTPGQNAGQAKESSYMAWKLYSEGNYPDAAVLYRKLSASDPDAYLGLGLSLYMMKDFGGAARALENYIAQGRTKNPLAKKALAFTYFELDELDISLRYAGEAIAEKDDADLRMLLARLKNEIAVRGSALKEMSAHFTVIFDGYTQGGMSRQVLGILEDAYSKIGSEMGHFPARPVTVILYGERDFVEVLQKPQWAGGIFDGKIRLPVRGAGANPALLRQILFHEYTHALVHDITPNCPVWINEGLAEYFSRPRQETIGQVIPLAGLEKPFSQLNVPLDTAYLESYSAVKYLIDRHGLFKVRRMLEGLGAGLGPEEAFAEAFATGYDRFTAEWGR